MKHKFTEEILLIDAPAGVLEVGALWQDDSDAVAILCHPNPMQGGTMNNKVVSTMYRFCRDAQMSVLRFNFRGVGRSSGETGYGDGEFEDAMTVLRYALAKTGARRLYLGGFSFGGYIACRVADALADAEFAELQLTDLALIAPSVVKNDTTNLTWHADRTYVIYGAHDELVAPSALATFAKQRALATTVIDTGHFFHAKLVELKAALQAHFAA